MKSDTRKIVREAATTLADAAGSRIADAAIHAGERLADKAGERYRRAEYWAEAHPSGSFGLIFGLGLLAGFLLGRR